MIISKLTKNREGVYGLPVVEMFRARAVTGDDGTKHPANIFDLWADAELMAAGFARLDGDDVADGFMSTGFSDAIVDSRVVRSHTMKSAPVAPDPKPTDPNYDAASLRRQNLGATTEDIVDALWERIVDNRPGPSDAIAARRATLKLRFPDS
jgi:hypothetical protein